MANYKVAQDVEADDKLLGPFGFRQFIYLIIVAMAGFLGYGLWQLFPPLAILPAPIILLFGALALPLRKDQPMETYLAAMVSFYLKPRRRLWEPDGVEHIVEIIAPKVADESLTKSFGAGEADRRLSYLADIADSRGWAIRHATIPNAGTTSMISDIYNEAQATQDILDESGNVAQNIESLINKSDQAHRQKVIASLHTPQPAPAPAVNLPAMPEWQQANMAPATASNLQAFASTQPPTQTYSIPTMPVAQPSPQSDTQSIQYNPYPTIHQSVVQPIDPRQAQTQQPRQTSVNPPQRQQPAPQRTAPQPSPSPQSRQQSTSDIQVSPDIMNLANNSKNLSVETIAHEARRIHESKDDKEVVISLR